MHTGSFKREGSPNMRCGRAFQGLSEVVTLRLE
jgi:hypothetical protein